MSKISITREESQFDPKRYELTCFDNQVDIVVTNASLTSKHLQRWINGIISDIYYYHCNSCNNVSLKIIGLSVELRPTNFDVEKPKPVAILQLCVGRQCLVFQLYRSPRIPALLKGFLEHKDLTFVGVGIQDTAFVLKQHYDLEVSNIVDLRTLAYERLGKQELLNVGLTDLAKEVLKVEYEKPKEIASSQWDDFALSNAQVQYASIDAFLCFSIGLSLNDAKIVQDLQKTIPNVIANKSCKTTSNNRDVLDHI